MEIKAGTYTLMKHGDASWAFSGFRVNGSRLIQEAGHLRAEGVKKFDRKNARTTVDFTVTRTHESLEDAESHVLSHELDVPNRATVSFIGIGLTGNRVRRYLENAGIETVDVSMVGRTTFTTYRIAGGRMLKQNPGTNASS